MDLAGVIALLTIVFLVVTMAGIGMRLGPGDVPTPERSRAAVRLGIVSLGVVPLVGVGLVLLVPLPPAAAFAVLALAAAPAGTIGPKLVQMTGGDLGLGVLVAFSLSAIATLSLAPTLILATRSVGLEMGALTIEAAPIIGRLAAFQLAPLLVGVVLGARRPGLASRILRPLTGMSSILLVAVVILVCVDGWEEVIALGPVPFATGLVLLAAADLLGWLAGGPTPAGRRTGLLLSGQRSGALALLVAIGIGWPGAAAAVVALAVLNVLGNALVALVLLGPSGRRAAVRAASST